MWHGLDPSRVGEEKSTFTVDALFSPMNQPSLSRQGRLFSRATAPTYLYAVYHAKDFGNINRQRELDVLGCTMNDFMTGKAKEGSMTTMHCYDFYESVIDSVPSSCFYLIDMPRIDYC